MPRAPSIDTSSSGEPFQINHFQLSWDAAKQSHQETIASIESGALAITLILGVVGCSTIAANYLYRWIEVPALRLKL